MNILDGNDPTNLMMVDNKTPGTPLNVIVLKKDGSDTDQIYSKNQALLSIKQSQYNESLNSQFDKFDKDFRET